MKPLTRRLAVAVALLLAVATGVVLLARSLADNRFRTLETAAAERLGPVEPGAYAPSPAAETEEPTASDRLLGSMPAFTYTNQPAREVRRLARRSAAEWSGEDLERVRRELLERAGTLAALRTLPEIPAGTFGLDYEAGVAMRLPDVYTLLEHGLLLRLHAGIVTLDGDFASAVRSVEAQGMLVRVVDQEPVTLLQLFALRIEQLQLWAIHDLLAAGLDDPALIERLADSLRDRQPVEAMRRMVGFELATMLALVREQRRGLGRLAEESWRSSLLDSTVGPWLTMRALERHLAVAEAAERPWPQARGVLQEIATDDLPGPYENLVADFRIPLRYLQANAGVTGLARRALATAAVGHCPETAGLPPEGRWISPFSGTALRVLRLEGGDCALSLPRDHELWEREAAGEKPAAESLPDGWGSPPEPELPWTWVVPAPGESVSAS